MKKTATIILCLLGFVITTKGQHNVGSIPLPPGAVIQVGQVSQVGSHMVDDVISCSQESAHHCGPIMLEDCLCDESSLPPACGTAGTGGSTQTKVRTVATGQTIIPAIQTTETVDCITNGNEETHGYVWQDANCHDQFSVCGAFRTSACESNNGNECEDSCWATCGTDDCNYHEEHATCCPCKCECHPISAPDFDEYCDAHCKCDEHCTCDHICKKEESCSDPVADIEHKINSQVDKILSDILSAAIQKCVSTSLEGCIQI